MSLLYVKLTQEEMYDYGNSMPVTHHILYDRDKGIAIDITADIKQAPLLSKVPEVALLDEDQIGSLEVMLLRGVEQRRTLSKKPNPNKIEYESLNGDQFTPILEYMERLNQNFVQKRSLTTACRDALRNAGIITKQESHEDNRIVVGVTLDEITKQRLKAIVVDSQANPYFKAQTLLKLGFYEDAAGEAARFLEFQTGYGAGFILSAFNRIEALGLGEGFNKQAATRVYEFAKERRKQLDESIEYSTRMVLVHRIGEMLYSHVVRIDVNSEVGGLEWNLDSRDWRRSIRQASGQKSEFMSLEKRMAEYLGFIIDPELEKADDNVLIEALNGEHPRGIRYIDHIRVIAGGFSAEKVAEYAAGAYDRLMDSGPSGHPEAFYNAVLLANEYLDRKRVLDAAAMLVSLSLEEKHAGGYQLVESAFQEAHLPEEMVHTAMINLFKSALGFGKGTVIAKKIGQVHAIKIEEISSAVSEVYAGLMRRGEYETAANVRSEYGTVVQDNAVSLEDLKLLAGIVNH